MQSMSYINVIGLHNVTFTLPLLLTAFPFSFHYMTITRLLHDYYRYTTGLLQNYYMTITELLQDCYMTTTVLLHDYYMTTT